MRAGRTGIVPAYRSRLMPDILFIKTSSLGDVIHHMPAAADARRHFPDARIAWVVEQALAPLVRLHPAVNEVIPVAARRWWGLNLLAFSTWREAFAFKRLVRARPWACDRRAGLMQSRVMACSTRAPPRLRRNSIRSPLFLSTCPPLREPRAARDRRNRALPRSALGYSFGARGDYGHRPRAS